MTEPTTSPLAEADPRSLEQFFNSRPPFDPRALQAIVAEMRRMRVKWGEDEKAGKIKKAAKAEKAKRPTAVDDIFAEGEDTK